MDYLLSVGFTIFLCSFYYLIFITFISYLIINYNINDNIKCINVVFVVVFEATAAANDSFSELKDNSDYN